jgi:transposase-like protein
MNESVRDRPELEQSAVIAVIPAACADEQTAVEFFEWQRWNGKPTCPHCKSADVYKMTDRDGTRNRRFLWRCRSCKEQYTVRIGSIFEDSRLPLRHWAYAFWRACTSKKGVSAREIQRQCQITYKSALFLMHRIRFAVTEDVHPNAWNKKFDGTCEIDETYVGGKPRPQAGNAGPAEIKPKSPVVAMLERGGRVRTKVVATVNHKNLNKFIHSNVKKSATVNTDQFAVYNVLLRPWARHDRVNHSRKEYARTNPDGTVSHVNTAESFFSLLKRGIMGTFHSLTPEHLHRYCHEFSFRWNTRQLNDGERVTKAITIATGKRLRYADYVCRK